jgi:hypothetical protein
VGLQTCHIKSLSTNHQRHKYYNITHNQFSFSLPHSFSLNRIFVKKLDLAGRFATEGSGEDQKN